jgi:hypothetical protein
MLLVNDQHAQIALHAHGRWQLLPAHRAWLSRAGVRLRVEVAGRSLHLAGDHPAAATLRATLRRPAADRPAADRPGAGRPSVAVAPLRRIARRLRAHPAVRAEGPYPLPRRTALTHAPADRDPNGATPREPSPTRAGTDVPAR